MLCADMERVLVDLEFSSVNAFSQHSTAPQKRTFFNLALKKLLTRNLNRSSSVCITMSLKFVFGSIFPV